jgi:hypothetical protein
MIGGMSNCIEMQMVIKGLLGEMGKKVGEDRGSKPL